MSAKVYKYDLGWIRSELAVDSKSFRPLAAGCQGDQIVLWAEVEPGTGQTKIVVSCVNTGGDVPPGLHYLGTVTTSHGIVWHVYTERPR